MTVVPLKVPILKIPFDQQDADQISGELTRMLLEGRLAMGPMVARFEEEFRRFIGTDYACGCSNGTAALEMIFRALQVQGGSVAIPANTFMATAMAALAAGAKIILVDSEPHDFQMSADDLAAKIRPDTKAVVLVHVGGFISPHWRRIKQIASQNRAAFIEDAAHAHGSEIDGLKAGALGLAGAFSFFPTKVLTTAEGGMVTTSEAWFFERLLTLRQHGQSKPGSNIHESFGLNFRPSEIHALLGLRLMAKANWIVEQRRRAAAVYDRLLEHGPVIPIKPVPGLKPSYYKYMALLPPGVERSVVKERVRNNYGVALAGEVYATAGNLQPLWSTNQEYLAAPLTRLPVLEELAPRQICLPIWPGLSDDDQSYVVESLVKVLEGL
ncbi:MAG: DegT/DnrJ/EryC1/StrS family aminotransferase [Deltaproteobacteria bacterium]|jgi:dTDP-4-amino-4,6-dideoxygalactose transaminase|nr:DegT/DnrJ/EryC1/StrS family aminotransferase [Deltaproteobacteria bacterium]